MYTSHTEQRLIELEIKASYTEDLVEQLNQVIIRQQGQIDTLVFEVTRLRQQLPEAGATNTTLRDELPPHY